MRPPSPGILPRQTRRVPGQSFFGTTPVVIGHRGAGEGPEENTLGSFLAAVALGASWVEADVQMSLDGTLFLQHNLRLRDGRVLRELTTAEASAAGVLRLDELHGALPQWVGINLEIKGSIHDLAGDSVFERCERWAAQRLGERPILVTSFTPLLGSESSVAQGLLTGRKSSYHVSVVSAVRLGLDVVAVHSSAVLADNPDHPAAAEVAAAAEQSGLSIMAWGVKAPEVAALLARGVRALCADDIAGVRAELGAAARL